MAGVSTISFADYSREVASMQVNHVTPNETTITTIENLMAVLLDATLAISRGTPITRTISQITRYNSSVSGGTDAESQREEKWLVQYEDVTPTFGTAPNTVENANFLKVFSVEIPCADLSLRDAFSDEVYRKNGSVIRADDPLFTAWVGAFEAVAKSPSGGAVVVRSIRAVGRNT